MFWLNYLMKSVVGLNYYWLNMFNEIPKNQNEAEREPLKISSLLIFAGKFNRAHRVLGIRQRIHVNQDKNRYGQAMVAISAIPTKYIRNSRAEILKGREGAS